MGHDRIDALSRVLAAVRGRRAVVRIVFATAVASGHFDGAAGKRKKRKKTTSGCNNHYTEEQILGFISKAAKKYHQSRSAMERVARCESTLNPCAVNREGPYYGLYQFLKSTWKTTPYGNVNIFDPEAQALAAGWMWAEGRKNEWACK
jgi:Transglycosylase SLT domain